MSMYGSFQIIKCLAISEGCTPDNMYNAAQWKVEANQYEQIWLYL